MHPIRLLTGFLTVGFWTFASRILGFVREIMIANYLGASAASEAFYVAFSLPNMFRRFFAEGAFNMAFVPMFSKKLESGQDPAGFARDAMAGLASVLILLTLIAQLAMPVLVLAMASGFVGDARFDLAVDYGRIAFPYILFISLAALLSGVLNATGRFAAAAAAPTLLNVIFVGAMIWAAQAGWPIGNALAWAVPVAGIAQLALVWFAADRAGFRLIPRLPRLTPELRRLAVIAAPAMLAGGVVQVNLLVGRQVASQFDGAIAWLNFADRLYQLPLGVVGIAIGVVLLPDLSRKLASDDHAGGRASLSRAAEFALMLTLPSAIGLLALAAPIVTVLYERGQFGADDSTATALAVAIYGLGLPAFVLQKVYQPLYFAREDTRSPFRFALVAMVVNAVIAIGLAPVFGFAAAALATTLAGWVMLWLLWRGTRGMGEVAQLDTRFTARLPRIALAALAMGALCLAAALALGPMRELGGWRYLALAGLILLGIVSYFGIGARIGAFALSDLRGAMRRRRG